MLHTFDEHESVIVLGLGAGKPVWPSCTLPGVLGVCGPPPECVIKSCMDHKIFIVEEVIFLMCVCNLGISISYTQHVFNN